MTFLALSTQRNYIYVNISGLDTTKILDMLVIASKRRYYKIHGFYKDIEDVEDFKRDLMSPYSIFFDSVEDFLKW